jgi:hypothetical protein
MNSIEMGIILELKFIRNRRLTTHPQPSASSGAAEVGKPFSAARHPPLAALPVGLPSDVRHTDPGHFCADNIVQVKVR